MCYMMAAGKKATADGSTMVARNCDSNSTEAQRIIAYPRMKHQPGEMIRIPDSNQVVFPQVEETYAFIGITRYIDGDDIGMIAGGVNEFQLSAGASTGGWLKKEVEDLCPIPEKVLGDYRMQLLLERCKTAREAILWLGENVKEYGARTDNYIVADPDEVWFYEEYQAHHWAAVRVPDDCFVVEANSFRIADFYPEDTDNYLCDPDLIPFAIKHGLWDPKSGQPFNVSRAYASNDRNRPRGAHGEFPQPYYSLHRIWRGISLLNSELKLDQYEPTQEYPLFVKPSKPLTPEMFLNVLKDTYEGTDLDEYGATARADKGIVDPHTGHYRIAPAWCKSRIIGCPQTITSWVTQCRNWLPNEMGALIWAGLGATACSPHLPFYACHLDTPKAYQIGDSGDNSRYLPDSAYWLYENIGNIMNLFYDGTVSLVKPVWSDFDKRNFEYQSKIEEIALDLFKEDKRKAIEFLTSYSNGVALEALEVGQDMIGKLFTRLALVNNPQTSRGYENPADWKSSGFIY